MRAAALKRKRRRRNGETGAEKSAPVKNGARKKWKAAASRGSNCSVPARSCVSDSRGELLENEFGSSATSGAARVSPNCARTASMPSAGTGCTRKTNRASLTSPLAWPTPGSGNRRDRLRARVRRPDSARSCPRVKVYRAWHRRLRPAATAAKTCASSRSIALVHRPGLRLPHRGRRQDEREGRDPRDQDLEA